MNRIRGIHSRAFTLVELLVVIAIIALLISILLPSLSRARDSAKSTACGAHLRSFSSAFEMYASQDPRQARSSGAFDHLRDGDVREFGWVRDVMKMKVGVPGKMLCPSNPFSINEKVADYTGAATTGSYSTQRWPSDPLVPIVPVGIESEEFWLDGYNTNYATTWQFSRGDPTAADGYGSDGDASDPKKCPLDGDGPLNDRHLNGSQVSADRIALMGDSRVGDSSDSLVTGDYADTINDFAGERVVNVGDFTVESFTDGMSVDYGAVTGVTGRKGHEFNDIAPLHNAENEGGQLVGGYANILFADGHVAPVNDTGGAFDKPDGFLGPYKTDNGFEINDSAFKELRRSIWYGRLRPRYLSGGGSIE